MIIAHKVVSVAQVVERWLRDRVVMGSKPGRAIQKALEMVPMATLLEAQRYEVNKLAVASLLSQKSHK